MKLLELYDDLFQYICRLNRAARTDAHPEFARVRGEVKSLLDDIKRNATSDVRLLSQSRELELPIVFFVDNLICTSRLRIAPQWVENRLARELYNELAGDERFFDFLEKDLINTSDEAAERLAVYYTCLGLGFAGMYQGRPDQLRKYIDQMFPRIRQWLDNDPRTKISEEAYRYTDTRVLTEPPSNKIILVALLFVFLSLSALAVYYGLYFNASKDLKRSISVIVEKSKS